MSEGRRPTLLLVDDEPGVRASLERSLRREGYEILTADSGRAALEVLDRESVDLLVSDHKMPGMSGIELLEQAHKRWPDLPKILISGWVEAVDESQLRALGVGALLSKPWDDGLLKQTLRDLLGLG